MAISSSTFGRTVLTGKDAEQFLRQIEKTEPNENAKRLLLAARFNFSILNISSSGKPFIKSPA